MYACICVYVFVCLCICEFMHMCIKLSTLDMRTTHIHIYAIIIYLNFCMYVYLCVHVNDMVYTQVIMGLSAVPAERITF